MFVYYCNRKRRGRRYRVGRWITEVMIFDFYIFCIFLFLLGFDFGIFIRLFIFGFFLICLGFRLILMVYFFGEF